MCSALVSTPLGCEGFPLAGKDVVAFADDAPAFAQAVVALLQDPARRRQMGEAGRAFVEANYGWGAIVPKLKAVYHELGVEAEG